MRTFSGGVTVDSFPCSVLVGCWQLPCRRSTFLVLLNLPGTQVFGASVGNNGQEKVIKGACVARQAQVGYGIQLPLLQQREERNLLNLQTRQNRDGRVFSVP